MSLFQELQRRSDKKCELCGATSSLEVYEVKPVSTGGVDGSILACTTCISQMEGAVSIEANHWRCLNDSMWSEFLPVQIMSWRMLNRVLSAGWSQDLLDMMYLDDETLDWAKSALATEADEDTVIHKDSNGAVLSAGDTVTLIKDLDVKGTSFTAKRGTAVRNISLVQSNPEHIEGRVNGTQIVILTKFVKRAN